MDAARLLDHRSESDLKARNFQMSLWTSCGECHKMNWRRSGAWQDAGSLASESPELCPDLKAPERQNLSLWGDELPRCWPLRHLAPFFYPFGSFIWRHMAGHGCFQRWLMWLPDCHKWKAAYGSIAIGPRPSLSVPVALASGIPADCCARFGTSDQDCWLVLWGAAQRHRWNHWNRWDLDSVQGQILELNFKHSLLKEGEANLWAIGSS